MELCRSGGTRRISRLQLSRDSHADFRIDGTFARGVGEETDVVAKEMYTWEDRGRAQSDKGQSLTLRPENTASVVRAYIEHKLWERGLQKLYYIGPQFRRERPQKGRYRQFYQIGAEVIGPTSAGSESPARDAEVLELLATLLDRLGIQGWTLQLNSVGCTNDRAAYNEALRKALEPVVSGMCVDCQRRAVTNPLRVFDCKVPEDQPIIEKLPRISQFLDEGCRQHFEQVQAILKAVGVPFTLNDRLVRGLDYYTRTAFEFTHGALGAQNAILGGGRYDGLSESLGGPPALPASALPSVKTGWCWRCRNRPKLCSASRMCTSHLWGTAWIERPRAWRGSCAGMTGGRTGGRNFPAEEVFRNCQQDRRKIHFDRR